MDKKNTARRSGPDVAIEDDERHAGNVDAYIKRNFGTLNASIKKSRAEIAKSKSSAKSVNDIVKDGRARLSAKR